MKTIDRHSEKNKHLCSGCDDCCHYIAVEIDRPTSKTDYQNIIWFLLHKNVKVYISWDNDWFLEFVTPCLRLDKNGLCGDYENRPRLCRDYHQDDCTRYNEEPAEKILFDSADAFKKYLKRKKINWEFKK